MENTLTFKWPHWRSIARFWRFSNVRLFKLYGTDYIKSVLFSGNEGFSISPKNPGSKINYKLSFPLLLMYSDCGRCEQFNAIILSVCRVLAPYFLLPFNSYLSTNYFEFEGTKQHCSINGNNFLVGTTSRQTVFDICQISWQSSFQLLPQKAFIFSITFIVVNWELRFKQHFDWVWSVNLLPSIS